MCFLFNYLCYGCLRDNKKKMTILITADNSFICIDEKQPEVGRKYNLEDASNGTDAQNRLFHSLLSEYYNSGLWSYQGSGYRKGATLHEFREIIKRKLGAGFEVIYYADYVDGKAIICQCKTIDEIPEHVRADKDMRKCIQGRLLSWAKYTKTQRRKTVDNLISEMHQVGVNTPHFMEILEGISKNDIWGTSRKHVED